MLKKQTDGRRLTLLTFLGAMVTLLIACNAKLSEPLAPSPVQVKINKLPKANLTPEQLQIISEQITVKILSGKSLGSGVIIHRQDSVYMVVTNDHVLRSATPPFQVQTRDGRIYQAQVEKRANALGENDLAVLSFNSNQDYRVAKLGTTLKPGEMVFAAGFPLMLESNITSEKLQKDSNQGLEGFTFRSGEVYLVLEKALEGGYQVGYTNEIEKGMSGGSLLNHRGELVAINGMHAYPLWGDPYVYEDGSQPSAKLREKMVHYSWGIPIETFLAYGQISSGVVF